MSLSANVVKINPTRLKNPLYGPFLSPEHMGDVRLQNECSVKIFFYTDMKSVTRVGYCFLGCYPK